MPYPKKYNVPDRWCYITVAGAELGIQIASLIAAGAATGASVVARNRAASAQVNQFQQEQLQLRLQQVDASTKRTDQLRRIFGEQAVQEIARGVSLASPSFQAIQQQSFNAFNDDNRAASLSESFKENALNSQIDATRSAAHFGDFVAIANFGASAFNSMNLNNNISHQPTFDSRDARARKRGLEARGQSLPSPF